MSEKCGLKQAIFDDECITFDSLLCTFDGILFRPTLGADVFEPGSVSFEQVEIPSSKDFEC